MYLASFCILILCIFCGVGKTLFLRFNPPPFLVSSFNLIQICFWHLVKPPQIILLLFNTKNRSYFSSLHTNISMHIFHTILYLLPIVLTWRICLTIKSLFCGLHFLYYREIHVKFRGDIVRRNIIWVKVLKKNFIRLDLIRLNWLNTKGYRGWVSWKTVVLRRWKNITG